MPQGFSDDNFNVPVLVSLRKITEYFLAFTVSFADPDPRFFDNSGSGIRERKKLRTLDTVRNKHPGSYFQELSNNYLG
jgi:hypothetical protein